MTASVLKWPGGKAAMVQAIADAFEGPCPGIYFEPFLGSGAPFLGLAERGLIRAARLSDANGRLIDLWRVLASDGGRDRLQVEIEALPWGEGWRPHYDRIRDAFNGERVASPETTAARLLWLNRACFNGLYRESAEGNFNTPPGSYESIAPPFEGLDVAALFLRRTCARVERAHFRRVLSGEGAPGEGDFVFADPPYHDPGAFVTYGAGGWRRIEQDELVRTLAQCVRRGARVVVTNPGHPKIVRQWTGAGFRVVHEHDVPRPIGARADRRKAAPEVILRAG